MLRKTRFQLGLEKDLQHLKQHGEKIMAKLSDVQAKLTELEETVAQQTTVNQSAVALANGLSSIISSLRQELADARAGGDPAAIDAIVAKMTEVETNLENSAKSLADAITTNTPSNG